MYKSISLVAGMTIFATSLVSEDKMSVEGYIRTAYQLDNPKRESSYKDFSLGGMLQVKSASFHGFSSGVTFFTTNALFGDSDGGGIPFFDSRSNGYTIIGEAYLQGDYANTTVRLGRQLIDTPFADSDDTGMVPNSFEAYTMMNTDLENTTIIASYITKMSGVDADIPESFTKVNGDDGIYTIGFINEYFENTTLQGWHYHMPDFADFSYLESSYQGSMKKFDYFIALQFAHQAYENDESTSVYGLLTSLSLPHTGITLLGAYDKSTDIAADNGFGGGPFFVNAEHMTLSEAGYKGEVFTYGFEYNLEALKEGVVLTLLRSELKDANKVNGHETDLVLGMDIMENLHLDAIYSNVNNDISGDKFDNTRIFINYTF